MSFFVFVFSVICFFGESPLGNFFFGGFSGNFLMLSAMDVLEEVVLNSFSFSLCLCGSEKSSFH